MGEIRRQHSPESYELLQRYTSAPSPELWRELTWAFERHKRPLPEPLQKPQMATILRGSDGKMIGITITDDY
jgi:hypothetical protein